MADAYHESCIVFVLYVKCRRLNGERQDIAAVLNFSGEVCDRLDDKGSGTLDANLASLLHATSDLEQPVFIAIVEVPKKAEQRRMCLMCPVVRLYSLNDCPHCAAQMLNSVGLPDEIFVRIGDRELQDPFIGRRVGFGLANSDCVDKMVKGGTQVVNEITENQCPPVKVGDGRQLKVDAVELTLRIVILGENIWILLFPNGDFVPDGFGVFICTLDFEPAA